MGWEIKGEAGKNLDATLRSFEDLNITAASLKFQSLAEDTFTWTAGTTSAAGGGTTVPEVGQVVSLFLDGNRKFRGHVMRPRRTAKGVTVTVQGPWWWMQRIYLTQNQTDANGVTDERVQYIFPTGNLRTNIIALLDRAIANGVPMLRGTGTQIAEMYDFTKTTLSNMTVAAALAKMLAKVPDAVAWFDYTIEGENPKLKIARRNGTDAAAAQSFTIGTDIFDGDISIYPREDLEVTRVELPYMDRNPTTGKPRFQRQSNGTAETGKLQIITVSGPEILDYLPKEDFESYAIKTNAAASLSDAFISVTDPQLAAIKNEYGIVGGEGTVVTDYAGTDTNKTLRTKNFPGVTYTRDNGDVIGTLTGRHVVTSQSIPQWAVDQYNGIPVTVTGTWIAIYNAETGTDKDWSDGFEALRAGAQTGGGFRNSDEITSGRVLYKFWLARPFSFRAVLINTSFPASTTVYKAWDFDFVTPPAGMAQGLRIAQNWKPYDGQFTLCYDEVTGTNELGKPVNIFGSITAHQTMKALVKSLTYDIKRGRATYQLGAPARTDLGTAMGRVSTSPQDVIVYL